MKKIIGLTAFLFTLVYSSDVRGQFKLENHIVGRWKASKVYDIESVLPPEFSKEQIEMIQKKFIDSKFRFEVDRNFSFECSVKEMTIKNGHWKILGDNGEIVIQEWKDKDKQKPVLMGITILLKDGKTIFMIEETFFAFEMIKITEGD